MRTRSLALAASLAVGLTVLVTGPASATYLVAIDFPGTVDEFYSPFDGPASISFTFDGSEQDKTFKARLRLGSTVLATKDIFVDADDPDGTHVALFRWPDLSVSTDKTFTVTVSVDGGPVASESFQLHPKLVSIVSANPNPFLPTIDDDIKDETTIAYQLSNDTQSTEAHVYRPNDQGKCCGNEVDSENLGPENTGTNTWVWDGRRPGGDAFGKGNYFVRIRGEDTNGVVGQSNGFKVSIALSYLDSATKQKSATAYHHIGPVTSYLRGGNCFATDAQTDLWITCLHAKFTIYWRWSIPAGSKITRASFTFIPVSGDICKYTKGYSGNESWIRAGATSGQVRCRIDLAKIRYSYPVAS